ncbi:MAG: glutathione S-transferase [Polymorphobacter sp.]
MILHHYEASPVSELVRIALGIKGAAWQSVLIPNLGAKPELAPLTGGYRKTPVLQIGADIYCDSAAIIDAIEAHCPEPTLFPAPLGALARVLASWAGGPLFGACAVTALAPVADAIPAAFWDDRKALFGFGKERALAGAGHLPTQVETAFAWIDATLADDRTFIGGDAAGYADAALYMLVWFVATTRGSEFTADKRWLTAWSARVAAIGHGHRSEISAETALAVATAAIPDVEAAVAAGSGFVAGQAVTVRTEDPGANVIAGRLARLSAAGITILRDDTRVGTVAVHFPRLGQIVLPA